MSRQRSWKNKPVKAQWISTMIRNTPDIKQRHYLTMKMGMLLYTKKVLSFEELGKFFAACGWDMAELYAMAQDPNHPGHAKYKELLG